MNSQTPPRRSSRTFLYCMLLLALLVLLVASSYTWFSLSKRPRVSELALYINAPTGLTIARNYDAEEAQWTQKLSFPDLVSEADPLKPVTYSQQNKGFFAVNYGFDGRMTDRFLPLSDQTHANRTDGNGYYVVGTFYARTDQRCRVSLAEAVELSDGESGAGTYVIGTPLWDERRLLHSDGGNGAETAIRLGFAVDKVNPKTGAETMETEFTIYEPNCDRHPDGTVGLEQTPSIDGTETLASRLILQSASEWSEANPVQREVTIKKLGAFQNNMELFSVGPGEIVRIRLYIWLEGQDRDCVNSIDRAQIFANVQFHTDYSGQSGLVDIPD